MRNSLHFLNDCFKEKSATSLATWEVRLELDARGWDFTKAWFLQQGSLLPRVHWGPLMLLDHSQLGVGGTEPSSSVKVGGRGQQGVGEEHMLPNLPGLPVPAEKSD